MEVLRSTIELPEGLSNELHDRRRGNSAGQVRPYKSSDSGAVGGKVASAGFVHLREHACASRSAKLGPFATHPNGKISEVLLARSRKVARTETGRKTQ
jgi:hypothetical protein